jgi:putative transposase
MTDARLTPEVKRKAENILKELGIPMSTAHEMFYRQIIAHKGLPFDERVPPSETANAISNAQDTITRKMEEFTPIVQFIQKENKVKFAYLFGSYATQRFGPQRSNQYHIVWVAKYRFRVLTGQIAEEVENCIRAFSEQQGCEVVELNVQADHVQKVSISGYVGTLKGRTAIRVFNRFRKLKEKPYWGNHFWARGYCVDTVGLDEEMIRKYIKYQGAKEKKSETPKH